MKFTESLTANLTMTAFEIGRQIEIFGTKGVLKGGHFLKRMTGNDIIVETFAGEQKTYEIDMDANDHHLGGDEGIMKALYEEMVGEKSVAPSSYIQSHIMAYAAEFSRVSGECVNLKRFCDSFTQVAEV